MELQANLIGIAIGFLTGIVIAIPPGPINFAIFEKCVHNHRDSALRLILGAVSGDVAYLCLVMLYQISSYQLETIKFCFALGGAVFLIGLGVYYLWFKKTPVRSPSELHIPEEVTEGLFWAGLGISLSNPFFILAMVAITDFYYQVHLLVAHLGTNLLFIVGFGLGVFTWLFALGAFTARRRSSFTGAHGKIRLTCGIAFIGFGVYMLGKFVRLLI